MEYGVRRPPSARDTVSLKPAHQRAMALCARAKALIEDSRRIVEMSKEVRQRAERSLDQLSSDLAQSRRLRASREVELQDHDRRQCAVRIV